MTTTNTLVASLRPLGGKGPSRRLRASGKIPAVAYGADIAATSLAVSPKELKRLLSGEHGLNTVVELESRRAAAGGGGSGGSGGSGAAS